ncbi:transglycosylase [Coniosporium apollinis]|uniref:chitinase n=1 Tax=Coniosporium apollinis TaxID=61459 RepID=A0ABQ9NYX8_9PEZI|nr:transglycosylase [Coniosporium apollinis]
MLFLYDPHKGAANLALGTSEFHADFTAGSTYSTNWTITSGIPVSYGQRGAEFTINKQGDSPTIQTDFYIFFGLVEIKMMAAPGTGIVSSIVMQSDDLDEIDWEFLGGDTVQVQTNYFGKGYTGSYDRGGFSPVSAPQSTFHTYTIEWTSSAITWSIDGTVVRTLTYTAANIGATNYFPQTPMQVKLGIWAGGDPSNAPGTVQWAGGRTDYARGPFTMFVKSVKIVNYNPGTVYQYGDRSGSWESIQIVRGSDASSALTEPE